MDLWVAPTNENKKSFINTLLCMNYSENEVSPLVNEDFTLPFVATIGGGESAIDILTIVHHAVSFDEAERKQEIFEIEAGLFLKIVPYDFLKDIKLRSKRNKDVWDIARLEELRKQK